MLKTMQSNLALMLISVLPNIAFAGVWTESGDAGSLMGTHQTPTGTGTLTSILEMLNGNPFVPDVDMYCIDIVDPSQFTATVAYAMGSAAFAAVPILWLFDFQGHGVTSQEGFYLMTPTKITGTYIPNPGKYYLAISPHDVAAFSSTAGAIWSGAPRSIETPPNGIGASGALTSWSSFGAAFGTGAYKIDLTGAGYCCDIPEPTSLLLSATAVGLLGFRRRLVACVT